MEKLVEKASVLIEALPYIRKFRGKEFLVKYGGALVADEEARKSILHDLVFMSFVGIRPILIHGGGPLITDRLKAEGVDSKFVDGLRVTDKKTMDIVADTLAELNKNIVHDINKLGAKAIGLSGHDNYILNVIKHKASGDVGYVGDVESVNVGSVKELTEANIIPVLYPLGIDSAEDMYNVNADEAAAKVAVSMEVQKIIILTNVSGILRVKDDDSTLISSVHVDEVEGLIKDKVISGGMIPKVKAAVHALKGGVKKAHIIDGRVSHSLLLEIFTDKGIGTEITI